MFKILKADNSLDSFRNTNSVCIVQKINNVITNCSKCTGDFDRKLYFGNPNAKVLIINEPSTNDENIINYYNELINSSELNIDDVFQVPALACISVRKEAGCDVQRCPSKTECACCKPYIEQIIDILNPKVIIALGATALNQFIPGSNIFDYVETTQEFMGIPTLINLSATDLFKLNEYKSESEMDVMIDSVINTFDKAAKYIKEE